MQMKLKNKLLLKTLWQASGQLRRWPGEPAVTPSTAYMAPFNNAAASIAPFKNAAAASATISADFELCWAWRNLSAAACEKRGETERNNIPFLIELLNRTKVPITWATVGHMFLDHCQRGAGGRAHPEMPRPPYNRLLEGDWYGHDPCANTAAAPGWYSPDLIQAILDSPVRHEFGCHSFSHIDFSEATSTSELVEAEMAACAAAMRPFGLKARSLVFCFNRPGYQHLDRLFKAGITSVRHRDARLRLSYPERTASGIYKLYESMNLRLASNYDYLDKAKVFVEEARKRGAAYHLWFHPSDNRNVFERAFAPIVEYLASQRELNRVWICTMSELAAYCEARRTTRVQAFSSPGRLVLNVSTNYNAAQYGETDLTLTMECPQRPASVHFRSVDGRSEAPVTDYRFQQDAGRLMVNVPCRGGAVEVEFSPSV